MSICEICGKPLGKKYMNIYIDIYGLYKDNNNPNTEPDFLFLCDACVNYVADLENNISKEKSFLCGATLLDTR